MAEFVNPRHDPPLDSSSSVYSTDQANEIPIVTPPHTGNAPPSIFVKSPSYTSTGSLDNNQGSVVDSEDLSVRPSSIYAVAEDHDLAEDHDVFTDAGSLSVGPPSVSGVRPDLFIEMQNPLSYRISCWQHMVPAEHQTHPDLPSVFRDAMMVREAVFVHEQGIPIEHELDSDDERSIHFVIYASKRVMLENEVRCRETGDLPEPRLSQPR